jgi:hypothetical protein
MMSLRVQQGLGWLSVGLGLTQLTFADGICRLLRVRGRANVVRLLGARELLMGMGLLSQRQWRPWVWGRVAGDALELSLVGATLGRPGNLGWRIAATAAVLGITLVDVITATQPPAPRRLAGLENLNPGAPMESWRGSGLAEDLGKRQQSSEPELDEAERQQRMRDAQHQLGLPDPDEVASRT